MSRTMKLAAIAAAGMAIGFVLSSLLGPNAATVPEAVQVALVGLLGGVLGALGGAAIGAYAATRVAERAREDARLAREEAARSANRATEINREEVSLDRRQRLHDAEQDRELRERLAREAETLPRRLQLFSELVVLAERHEAEVKQQASRRDEVADGAGDAKTIPSVESTDPMRAIVGQLYFLADEDSAERAWDLYQAVSELDKHVYDSHRHLVDGDVVGLDGEEYDELMDQLKVCGRARLKFTQEARRELGKEAISGRIAQVIQAEEENERREREREEEWGRQEREGKQEG